MTSENESTHRRAAIAQAAWRKLIWLQMVAEGRHHVSMRIGLAKRIEIMEGRRKKLRKQSDLCHAQEIHPYSVGSLQRKASDKHQ